MFGNATKGVIHNGIVNVYQLNQNGENKFIAATRTQSDGSFALDVPSKLNHGILIEINADEHSRMTCDLPDGCVEPTSGDFYAFSEQMPLPEDFSLLGYGAASDNSPVQISPLSHIIVTTAASLNPNLPLDSIEVATRWVKSDLGLEEDPLEVSVADITLLDNELTDAAIHHGLLSAAFYDYVFHSDWSRHLTTLDDVALAELFETTAELASDLIAISNTSGTELDTTLSSLANSYDDRADTYNASLSIINQPQTSSIMEGESAYFYVSASGAGPFSYQWYKNDILISGANESHLTLENAQRSDAGLYHVVVRSGNLEAASLAALLTVSETYIPMTITRQPQSQSLSPGQTLQLNVAVTNGRGDYDFQWRKGGSIIPGANASSLQIASVDSGDAGIYSVSISDNVRSIESEEAIITVSNELQPVSIHRPPSAETIIEGGALWLNVDASGSGFLNYQWRKDGSTLEGQNSATLTINPVQQSDSGYYDVIVSNSQGPVTSASALVTVLPADTPIQILEQPQSQAVESGGAAYFSVTVSGGANLSYQWFHNGEPITGANNSSLSLTNVSSNNTGIYHVAVSSGDQTESSLGALLSIASQPTLRLSWDTPDYREDGTSLALEEIQSYRIQYGSNETSLGQSLTIDGAENTSYDIENVSSGTYYLRIATVDTEGNTGSYSDIISISVP